MGLSSVIPVARKAVLEFSQNTSIHGIKYIMEAGRRWIERSLWLTTEGLCVLGAVLMVRRLWASFNEDPVLTRVDSYFHETWLVPFPAITLCNVNRMFRSKAQRLADKLTSSPDISFSKQTVLRLLPLLGHLMSVQADVDLDGVRQLDLILTHNNMTGIQALEELGQSCEELVERCSWEGQVVPCGAIIHQRLSFLGHCCSFNAAPNIESQPLEHLHTDYYGNQMGLTVLLNPMTDDYFWGPYASSGILCAVHDSNEMAVENTEQVLVASAQEVLVSVSPAIRTAASGLLGVEPSRRSCLFEHERPLITSGTYSHEGCLTDCKINATLTMCNCRPFIYMHSSGRPCTLDDISCMSDHFFELLGVRTGVHRRSNEYHNRDFFNGLSGTHPCGCQAQCNNVGYSLASTHGDFAASTFVHQEFYADLNSSGRTLLHVYFESQTVAKFVSDVTTNNTELMSSLGGIFSLFLGFSFMSVVELLYFSTVRVWVLLRGPRPRKLDAATVEPVQPSSNRVLPLRSSEYRFGVYTIGRWVEPTAHIFLE